jgi:Fe-S cluster assembly iron-binding protein IscA
MVITERAMRRIRRLKREVGAPGAGVRVSVRGGALALEWSSDGPALHDLVVRHGPPAVFIDARAFIQVADLKLDAEGQGPDGRFLVRRRPRKGRHAER